MSNERQVMTPLQNPVVGRKRLRIALRRAREASGRTQEQVADAMDWSLSKVIRIETGAVSVSVNDVRALLNLYSVMDKTRVAEIIELARVARLRPWWYAYRDHYSQAFQSYLDLEAGAKLLKFWQPSIVPGLLQTEAYARAVISLGYDPSATDEIDRRARLRMERKQLLLRPDAPKLWAVLDEAVLRRPIGGVDVLRGQIQSLIELTDLPGVRLQVMPFASGGHAASGGAFSLLRFPYQELSDVVYIEHLTGGLYLDRREEVDRYAAAIGRLFIEAAPLTDTPAILRSVLKDLG